MDQDYKTMMQMRKCLNIYNALYRYTHLQGEKIHDLTDGERITIRNLIDGGYFNG